jgi:hypothetical protein
MLITTEIKMPLGIKNAKKIINFYNLDKNLKPGDIVTIPIK